MAPEDAALVVHAVLPALEGRLQLLHPYRLSWYAHLGTTTSSSTPHPN